MQEAAQHRKSQFMNEQKINYIILIYIMILIIASDGMTKTRIQLKFGNMAMITKQFINIRMASCMRLLYDKGMTKV